MNGETRDPGRVMIQAGVLADGLTTCFYLLDTIAKLVRPTGSSLPFPDDVYDLRRDLDTLLHEGLFDEATYDRVYEDEAVRLAGPSFMSQRLRSFPGHGEGESILRDFLNFHTWGELHRDYEVDQLVKSLADVRGVIDNIRAHLAVLHPKFSDANWPAFHAWIDRIDMAARNKLPSLEKTFREPGVWYGRLSG